MKNYIDNFLKQYGVGLALLFLVIFLTYVNSLSLTFMFGAKRQTDLYFGVIGAVAYSIVTVLVMRLSRQKWLKYTFPVYDTALMFCGMILLSPVDVFDYQNKIRLFEIVFLSSFSGLITYSLGQINTEQHSNIISLNSNLKSDQNDIIYLKSEIDRMESEYKYLDESYKELEIDRNKLITDYNLYYNYYIKNEKGRILKKKPENRTPEEINILNKNNYGNN